MQEKWLFRQHLSPSGCKQQVDKFARISEDVCVCLLACEWASIDRFSRNAGKTFVRFRVYNGRNVSPVFHLPYHKILWFDSNPYGTRWCPVDPRTCRSAGGAVDPGSKKMGRNWLLWSVDDGDGVQLSLRFRSSMGFGVLCKVPWGFGCCGGGGELVECNHFWGNTAMWGALNE